MDMHGELVYNKMIFLLYRVFKFNFSKKRKDTKINVQLPLFLIVNHIKKKT